MPRASGPFKLGLQNLGIIKAAYDFGCTPPLEGGGIFQFGLQYGAGPKVRAARLAVRADFRESLSKTHASSRRATRSSTSFSKVTTHKNSRWIRRQNIPTTVLAVPQIDLPSFPELDFPAHEDFP